jgi:3-methyladenine DNA glycosylase AlkC
MPEESKLLKDWFDRDAAKQLAALITAAFPKFDGKSFIRLATRRLDELELLARVQQFSNALAEVLPDSYPRAVAILVSSLPPAPDGSEQPDESFVLWPLGQFIADRGTDHFDESLHAMTELTQRFTAEFAVRPFVEKHSDKTFKALTALTTHSSEHVRRWCSEGVRTRLPWGKKLHALIADPALIWPILEKLKDDPELYVRRSVANNVNDLAKDHPEAVIARCESWSANASTERKWVINHALRSLIKDGHPEALKVIGFGPPKKLKAQLQVKPKRISVGESAELTATLSSDFSRRQKLLIDYAVHYVRKGGKTGTKVFKWKKIELPARDEATLTKKHSMRISTIRALYPGTHKVELQVNGVRVAETEFELRK